MTSKKILGWICCGVLCAATAFPVFAQSGRGKAELKSGSAAVVTIDYGRPSLKGRDMLSQLSDGSFWRMGTNQAAVFTTSVDLDFGTAKVAKGSYSLWLKKEGGKFLLVFNSQTGQWGTQHDATRDVCSVPLKSESLSDPVETFTIDLKEAGKGGAFAMSWGNTRLTADFGLGT